MKKTCNNCKALDYNKGCILNFKNEKLQTSVYLNSIGIFKYKPLEDCPKPKTNTELSNFILKENNVN